MFLDGVAMIVLTAPLLFPVATALGINLFVMSGIAKLPVHEVVRGVLPFYFVRLTGLMLITFIPAISLVLL